MSRLGLGRAVPVLMIAVGCWPDVGFLAWFGISWSRTNDPLSHTQHGLLEGSWPVDGEVINKATVAPSVAKLEILPSSRVKYK